MASRRCVPLAAVLITISLDTSVIVVSTAAVAWNPKISRYDSYNLDKGPVFYEAYYPDAQDTYPEKRYFDRNTVLETSFQVPSDRFAYSAENADWSISSNESFVVDNKDHPTEGREAIKSSRDYEAANTLVSSHDRRAIIVDDNNRNPQTAKNIEEISKFVRKAISRDLENWEALEKYLERTANQSQPVPSQLGVSGTFLNHKDKENNGYSFQINRLGVESSKQPVLKVLRKLEARNVKQQPAYLKEVETSGNKITNEMSAGNTRVADVSIGVTSDSLPLENIFQPRPQVIRYTFFEKPMTRLNEQTKEVIDSSMSRNYGNNLIREEIIDDRRHDRLVKEDVKVMSIQVSELPRHKTRHHHGEWPKRDYSAHRHRSPAGYSIV